MTRIKLWNIYHRININNIVERQCTQCKSWMEENTDNFYLMNKSHPERGFSAWCKRCTIDKNNKRQKENYDIFGRPYQQEWRSDDEHRDTAVAYKKQWRIDKHDHKREYEKEYYMKYPEKHKIYNEKHRQHDITESEWRSCLKVFGNTCAYCGLSIEKHIVERNGKYIIMNFHKEHVDDKGYNDLRNAVPSCRSCNSAKYNSDMDDWYKSRTFYSKERYNFIVWWTTEGYKDYIESKPPYRIIRKQNEDGKTFHAELWSIDEKRNMIECIHMEDKKKNIEKWIKENYVKFYLEDGIYNYSIN